MSYDCSLLSQDIATTSLIKSVWSLFCSPGTFTCEKQCLYCGLYEVQSQRKIKLVPICSSIVPNHDYLASILNFHLASTIRTVKTFQEVNFYLGVFIELP